MSVDVETIPMSGELLDHFTMVKGLTNSDKGKVLETKIQNGLRTVFAKWN
jgi:hypothetical protein